MSILSISTDSAGQSGVYPRRVKVITTDSLGTVTTAGYLNPVSLEGYTIFNTDVIWMWYGAVGSAGNPPAVTNPGTFGMFLPSISNGVITLVSWANPGDVLLPVLSGHFATFNGTSGQIKSDATTAINSGNIQAGLSGTAGYLVSFPGTASKGSLRVTGVANTGDTITTISNAAMGQASVVSIPDPGGATANFVLDAGTAASVTATTGTFTNLKYGATPVAQVDPASCTITAAPGASNTATITIQLKDGSGTNMTRSIAFRVYSSSAADGLTLQSAASTGYSVASGGLSLANGTAVTTQISAMSSATGGCVLSLLDTGKQTSYLVLVLPNGNKISAQLSSGSYGA